MYTTYAKNKMLAALAADALSIHSAFPGLTGSNELTGGTYARVPLSFLTPSGSVRQSSGAVNVSVPVGATASWACIWEGANLLCVAPCNGSPREFVAIPSSNLIASPGHGLSEGMTITFYNGSVPGGLTEGATYYARNVTTDDFRVAASEGGSPLNITSAGSSDCLVSFIDVTTYPGGGTLALDTASMGLPL